MRILTKIWLFLPGIPVVILLSCTTTKNVQKSKTDEKTEIKTVETTTTTTTIDTTVVVKGDSLKGSEAVSDFENGKDLAFESGNIKVFEHFNPVSKKIETKVVKKPEVIPVHAVQRSVSNRTITTKKEVKTSDFSKEVKRSWWSWWYLLIVAGLLVWIFRKAIFSRML